MDMSIDHSLRQLRKRRIDGNRDGIRRHESSYLFGGQILDIYDLPIGLHFVRLAAKDVLAFLASKRANVQWQGTQNPLLAVSLSVLELENTRVGTPGDPWTGAAVLLDGPTEKVGGRENTDACAAGFDDRQAADLMQQKQTARLTQRRFVRDGNQVAAH
jgi:hypothetical protein